VIAPSWPFWGGVILGKIVRQVEEKVKRWRVHPLPAPSLTSGQASPIEGEELASDGSAAGLALEIGVV
jgi:hypothetical protein